MSITITTVSNNTVLVLQNVISSVYLFLWTMMSARRLIEVSPHTPSTTRFSPDFLWCFSLAFIKLLEKIIYFQSKTNASFELIASWFSFCYFVYTWFYGIFFYSSAIMKVQIKKCFVCMASDSASYYVTQNKNSWFDNYKLFSFSLVSEETMSNYLHNFKLLISFQECKERLI